jgi:hypothetical protein
VLGAYRGRHGEFRSQAEQLRGSLGIATSEFPGGFIVLSRSTLCRKTLVRNTRKLRRFASPEQDSSSDGETFRRLEWPGGADFPFGEMPSPSTNLLSACGSSSTRQILPCRAPNHPQLARRAGKFTHRPRKSSQSRHHLLPDIISRTFFPEI